MDNTTKTSQVNHFLRKSQKKPAFTDSFTFSMTRFLINQPILLIYIHCFYYDRLFKLKYNNGHSAFNKLKKQKGGSFKNLPFVFSENYIPQIISFADEQSSVDLVVEP